MVFAWCRASRNFISAILKGFNLLSSSRLEVISRQPRKAVRETPLLFIHGAYAGAWCWDVHYLKFFAQAGWSAHALSLSGHAGSAGRERLDMLAVEDYVTDVCEVVSQWKKPPVLIGHSMGGFVAQKFLEQSPAAGLVLMASVPPQGLVSAWASMVMRDTAMLWDLNRLLTGQHPSMDALRRALFHQPVSDDLLTDCYRLMQPESLRAIWDMSGFNLPDVTRMQPAPTLVLGAAEDHLLPVKCVHETAQHYGIQAQVFADMGHGMMIEQNWLAPAQAILTWLDEQVA